MSNILVILFAILDCKVWSIAQVAAWTNRLISKLDSPKTWLLDLSISASFDNCLEVVREAMQEETVN